MPNLRILYDNAADSATVTASTTSGSLAAANLLTDYKNEVHRSTTTVVSYTLTWASAKTVSAVILAFANYTTAATMRVRVYTLSGDSVPALDTGNRLCCPAARVGLYPMSGSGANSYAYGWGAYARSYFTPTSGQKVVIDVTDSGNTAGYLEAGRLVVGAYWSPTFNASYGVKLQQKTGSEHKRTDAGDLRTEIRPVSREISLDLALMKATDRGTLDTILRSNGIVRPVFLSVYPEHSDTAQEAAYSVYGKLDEVTVNNHGYGLFSAPLKIQEV